MTNLPFPALVGLETAQQALLLLAVEPQLRGLVISAAVGTGKSSLARSLRALLGHDAMPFVEAPPSTDVENLLGGLDLEATLRAGRTIVRHGLLARAHGGVVYVDGINLLTDESNNLLLGVLDEGEVRVERESISLRAPAHFSLIGSYDPTEGMPRTHLLDRVGLLVGLVGATAVDQRTTVVRNNLLTNRETWQEELHLLHGLVLAAREQLPKIPVLPEHVRQLSRLGLLYGVRGHRVDLFAVLAARAAAAVALHEEIEDEDLEVAMRLVILPRATQIPTPPEQPPPPPQAPPQQQPPPESPPESNDEEPPDDDQPPPESAMAPPEEQILSALNSMLPAELDELPFRHVRRGRSGSRGATDGNRGRHVRSIPGDPRRARIDASATLRVAAPWQPLRRQSEEATAQEEESTFSQNGHSAEAARPVLFQPSDIRVKQYRSKAGALFCFAVDASGSMALHRMRQAKGAVHALLAKAYVKRDRVALLAFRGKAAELLLPPSQSVELASRALDRLPTGGGTPLASALLLAETVAQQAKSRGIQQTILVLLTDGRANVPLEEGNNVREELQKVGKFIAASSLQVMVIDTQRSYLSRGEARQLAEWLGADYAYLPNADSEQIADLAASKAR